MTQKERQTSPDPSGARPSRTWQTKTDQILDANADLLLTPLDERGLNPHTRGLPLTPDEAWVLVQLGLTDITQGTLMTWGGDSDCPDVAAHAENPEGECLCWNGAMEAEDYDNSKAWFRADGPFEWWAAPKEVK